MSAYALASDIHKEFPGTIIPTLATDNKVGDDTLTQWISEASAEVDGKLSGRYTVPLTGSNALLVVKTIVIAFVAWRFAKATNMKNEQALPVQAFGGAAYQVPQAPNVSQAKASAFARLMGIAEGSERLLDAVELPGVWSQAVAEDYGPKFKMDRAQW